MEVEAKPVPKFVWSVPEELGVPPDHLRCRLDFHHQAVVMTLFQGEVVQTKVVSALDIAHALANDLSYGTGLLPPGTLWWRNTRSGPQFATYVEPKVWKLALELDVKTPPRRYALPMPGFTFISTPGQPPWVYSVKKKPTKETDVVYHAPLCNLFEDGRSCPGTHKYPIRIADMAQSFFTSFFTATANLRNRSKRFPNNVVQLWDYLDGKKRFPTDDLVEYGTVRDIMNMEIRR